MEDQRTIINAGNYNYYNASNINQNSGRYSGNIRRTTVAITPQEGRNFVYHSRVSKELLKGAQYQAGAEYLTTKYTAVVTKPEAFPSRYRLNFHRTRIPKRQGEPLGKIRIALVITMYNEGKDLFLKTLRAVQQNIAYLCGNDRWGPDGWKEFLVVIVNDGREKLNPDVASAMAVMGIFVPDLAATSVFGQPVHAHIFEFTTQTMLNSASQLETRVDGVVPMQVIFVLKEKNRKKINSHKWFFDAICESVSPEVTLLLDVGTKPSKAAFWHLYRAFELDPQVGGACGEIYADLGPSFKNLLNPLVASQNFEYKMSNILDKPLESVFGYIAVLPGAFSAYRYDAIKGVPLSKYFSGEEPDDDDNDGTLVEPRTDLYKSNLFLAEDRILCFELVAKMNCSWTLKYVKVT
jgi:chitin synthase